MSHPLRVRGLTCRTVDSADSIVVVAPFTGAWIEIRCRRTHRPTLSASHPSRVRGLKYADRGRSGGRGWSHPLRVRGLKCPRRFSCGRFSRPSHPSRVRGLKYPYYPARWVQCEVAPFTGAWIEITVPPICLMIVLGSHPSRVRGLKSSIPCRSWPTRNSRTLHGGVD